MPGEKTQAVWDYSEHATITQGQLLEKSSKNAIFLKVMWKTPLFKRLPRLARAAVFGGWPQPAGLSTPFARPLQLRGHVAERGRGPRAGIEGGAPTLGRPTCIAPPASLEVDTEPRPYRQPRLYRAR